MIHCLDENDPIELQPELVVKVPLDEDDLLEGEELGDGYAEAGINVRPHLMKMLREANKNFQVITFTASDKSYADAILDQIDPHMKLIQMRLYRDHCI
jgi:CTD small phosphatase-like protein 2